MRTIRSMVGSLPVPHRPRSPGFGQSSAFKKTAHAAVMELALLLWLAIWALIVLVLLARLFIRAPKQRKRR